MENCCLFVNAGIKKSLVGHPGRVVFLAGQVTVEAQLPDRMGCQGSRQVILPLNH